MVRVKFDQETLGLSSIFSRITRANVKDCFKEGEVLYFVVSTGELGKAIGKGGVMIKKVQDKFGKKVRVIEYRNDVVSFVRNVIYPVQVQEIVDEEGVIFIRDEDRRKKGLLIGRSGSNLAFINKVVKRFFGVKEVKVE